jgi:putative SOS response-associated peptidase YedK
MCGRFTNRLTWREIVALYRLTVPATPERNLPARYNICPTTTIDAVIEREGKRDLVPMRWGLVPSWWKKSVKETPSTFNARAETVAEKPMFRSAFKRNRCLIPASGYYEWQKTPHGKQPWYYTARDGSPLTIAGLWDEWKDIETAEPLKSCTMIITNANELVAEIATFAAAILLHSGIPIFGRVEERGIVEAFVQGTIGAAVAICAYSFWKRKAWARIASLVCQLVGIGGALFGMFVVLVQDDALNSIRTMRGN